MKSLSRPEDLDRHYSYAHYAKTSTAENFDALRFSGPIGTLLADTQARILADFLQPLLDGHASDLRSGESRATILDVGTGTGRAAIALALHGAHVTGIDASAHMLEVARRRATAERADVGFTIGDAHALTFQDGSFDGAVSLRVLMHTPDWRRCLGELCRVSRQRVVFDFPSLWSAAAIQAGGRRLLAALGRPVEAYRVMSMAAVRRELRIHGFEPLAVHRQFVLPIAVHKALGSRSVTERLERAFHAAGLLRLFGSPITVVAERCAS